jgi:hypothetical protein
MALSTGVQKRSIHKLLVMMGVIKEGAPYYPEFIQLLCGAYEHR